jgi:hypothetical protein
MQVPSPLPARPHALSGALCSPGRARHAQAQAPLARLRVVGWWSVAALAQPVRRAQRWARQLRHLVAAASQGRLHRGLSMPPDAPRRRRLPLAQSRRQVHGPVLLQPVLARQLALAPRQGKAPCRLVVARALPQNPALLEGRVPALALLRVVMRLPWRQDHRLRLDSRRP